MSENENLTRGVAPNSSDANEPDNKLKACQTWAEEKQITLDTQSAAPMELSLLKMSSSKEEWFGLIADWMNFSWKYAKDKREGAPTPAGIQWLLDNKITIQPPYEADSDHRDQLQKYNEWARKNAPYYW